MLDLAALETLARDAAAAKPGSHAYDMAPIPALAAGLLIACEELRQWRALIAEPQTWVGKMVSAPEGAKAFLAEQSEYRDDLVDDVKTCLDALRRVCAAVNNAPSCSPAIWTAPAEAEKLLEEQCPDA